MKNLIIQSSILFISMLFIGCDFNQEEENKPKYTLPSVGERVKIPVQSEIVTVTSAPAPKLRYELKKVQTFYDSDAYGGVRNVYNLIDSETGREYVGISGIGITEIGQHLHGKNNVQDER